MTKQEPRWYSINKIGMATLCADKKDAENVASTCDIDFQRQAPHRAVQLVEVSELDDSGVMRLGKLWSQARAAHPDDPARQNESFMAALGVFAELATAKERTARIEAQQRLADMQDLAVKAGLAHRKAVQEEAVADAMKRMQAGEKLSYTDKDVELIMLGWKSELQKAVAAEREACAELMERQHTWITNVAASVLIRARGTP